MKLSIIQTKNSEDICLCGSMLKICIEECINPSFTNDFFSKETYEQAKREVLQC